MNLPFYILLLFCLLVSSCCNREEKKEKKTEPDLKQFFEDIPFHALPYKDTINWNLDSAKLISSGVVKLLELKEILKAKTNYHMDGSKFYTVHKLNLSPYLNSVVICWEWSDSQLFNYLMIYDENFKCLEAYGLSDDENAEGAFHSYSKVNSDRIETHNFNYFARSEEVRVLRINKDGRLLEISVNTAVQEIFNCEYYTENSSLGIGILVPPRSFEIYNDSSLKNLYMKWDLAYDYNPPKRACSIFYKPDYGVTHYVCMDSSAFFYKILINSNEIKYCPKNRFYKFENWERYISHSVGIDLKKNEKGAYQPLMKEPREGAENVEEIGRICPGQIKGDWLQVYFCYPQNETISGTAWIKWRDGNKILIEIHQLI